jgi:hypothetical protein
MSGLCAAAIEVMNLEAKKGPFPFRRWNNAAVKRGEEGEQQTSES